MDFHLEGTPLKLKIPLKKVVSSLINLWELQRLIRDDTKLIRDDTRLIRDDTRLIRDDTVGTLKEPSFP